MLHSVNISCFHCNHGDNRCINLIMNKTSKHDDFEARREVLRGVFFKIGFPRRFMDIYSQTSEIPDISRKSKLCRFHQYMYDVCVFQFYCYDSEKKGLKCVMWIASITFKRLIFAIKKEQDGIVTVTFAYIVPTYSPLVSVNKLMGELLKLASWYNGTLASSEIACCPSLATVCSVTRKNAFS